jgi:hypothetical protein
LTCSWSIITTLTGLIQNFGGLVAVRFMLGIFEGGILPGVVSLKVKFRVTCTQILFQTYYLSTMYTRHELQAR